MVSRMVTRLRGQVRTDVRACAGSAGRGQSWARRGRGAAGRRAATSRGRGDASCRPSRSAGGRWLDQVDGRQQLVALPQLGAAGGGAGRPSGEGSPVGSAVRRARGLAGDADHGANDISLAAKSWPVTRRSPASAASRVDRILDGGRLARAVGPKQGEHGGRLDVEGDAVEDEMVAVGLAQTLGDDHAARWRHAGTSKPLVVQDSWRQYGTTLASRQATMAQRSPSSVFSASSSLAIQSAFCADHTLAFRDEVGLGEAAVLLLAHGPLERSGGAEVLDGEVLVALGRRVGGDRGGDRGDDRNPDGEAVDLPRSRGR